MPVQEQRGSRAVAARPSKRALSRLRADSGARTQAEIRRGPVAFQVTALFVGLAVLPLIPGGRIIAGVPWQSTAIWATTLLAGTWGAYFVHRAVGPATRAFVVAEVIETGIFAHGSAALAGLSVQAASIWWLVYFALCVFQGSGMGARGRDAVILGTAPFTAAAVAHARTHTVVDTVAALFVGGLGFIAWGALAKGADRSLLDAAEREALEERLAELERERDRDRTETERRHLGMELHDGLGATLTAARLMAQAVRDEASHPSHAERGAIFDQLDETLREGLVDLRLALSALDREVVGWTELFARVRRQGSEMCGAASIRFAMFVDVGDAGEAAPEIRMTVLRLVQESVTNAARHADATNVEVRVTREARGLVIGVEDDGVGMREARTHDGRGLDNMRRRVHALGGTITLSARDGGGTRVRAFLPCSW